MLRVTKARMLFYLLATIGARLVVGQTRQLADLRFCITHLLMLSASDTHTHTHTQRSVGKVAKEELPRFAHCGLKARVICTYVIGKMYAFIQHNHLLCTKLW